MKRLIIGCGYLGGRVARRWLQQGDDVWALTRSSEHAASLDQIGISPIVGDVLDPSSLDALPVVDVVLYAVGYDRSSPHAKRTVYVDGLRNVLSALPAGCRRLLYVSSTSVYGQSNGEWVDEASPCEPTSDGGRICLEAEHAAQDAFRGAGGLTILRLSGIYGPGRLAARVDALRQQKPMAANPDGWLNLIHVEDACRIAVACADLETTIARLLVSDDRPLQRRDYYEQLTQAIGAPQPVFEDAPGEDLGKRCSNRYLRESLGIPLDYPTLATGLPSTITK